MKALVIVDMQNDFVNEGGKLVVPGARDIIPNIQALINAAKEKGIKIIFTRDWHPVDSAEFKVWPPHCIQGTDGAKIIDEFADAELNVLIDKDELSAWTNPQLKELFIENEAHEVIVCGVATEYCVKAFVDGASISGMDINLVVDAISGVELAKGNIVAATMVMACSGAVPITTKDMIEIIKVR